MSVKKRGYFLLDAVLATLILSILLSAVLGALGNSLRGFRKMNEKLYWYYAAEKILNYKILLADNFSNSQEESGSYGDFSWAIIEKDEADFKRTDVLLEQGDIRVAESFYLSFKK